MNIKKLLFVISFATFLTVGVLASSVFAHGGNSGSGNSGSGNSRERNATIMRVRPRLDLRFPRGLEGCGPFDFLLNVTNRGTGTATDVVINIRIKKGLQFVGSTDPVLPFDWIVGDIPAGTSQSKNFRVIPNSDWRTTSPRDEIRILANVTQETTNPKRNLRRHDGSNADRDRVFCP